MWKSGQYPGYDYDNPPTTTRLGGISKRPLGTIVINNTNVSGSGTYTAGQAFSATYQNDGAFVMINTSSSTLVYNKNTDSYTLNNLQLSLPTGTSVLKFDTWSSQSSGNQNVHCYCSGGSILVPSTLGVTGLETFKGVKNGTNIVFTWTTQMEANNSHFMLRKLLDGEWTDMAMIVSQHEDGNSVMPTSYSFEFNTKDKQRSGERTVAILAIALLAAVSMRNLVPARLTMLICIMGVTFNNVACKQENPGESLEVDGQYQLKQVDKNGATAYSRTVTIYP
jgi:hypothetical protein